MIRNFDSVLFNSMRTVFVMEVSDEDSDTEELFYKINDNTYDEKNIIILTKDLVKDIFDTFSHLLIIDTNKSIKASADYYTIESFNSKEILFYDKEDEKFFSNYKSSRNEINLYNVKLHFENNIQKEVTYIFNVTVRKSYNNSDCTDFIFYIELENIGEIVTVLDTTFQDDSFYVEEIKYKDLLAMIPEDCELDTKTLVKIIDDIKDCFSDLTARFDSIDDIIKKHCNKTN